MIQRALMAILDHNCTDPLALRVVAWSLGMGL